MRGTMLIGLAVVLLIIGILVVKNMGADKPGAVQESQTKEYMEKAKTAAADAAKRLKDIKKQMSAVD
jgi:Na+-transporting methylmalonyl-CoA/oxaloacetate decarboxylase gamma subunit